MYELCLPGAQRAQPSTPEPDADALQEHTRASGGRGEKMDKREEGKVGERLCEPQRVGGGTLSRSRCERGSTYMEAPTVCVCFFFSDF